MQATNSFYPWRLNDETFQKLAKQSSDTSYKKITIQSQDPEFAFVFNCFQKDPPPNRTIAEVFAIHNVSEVQAFESFLSVMESEGANPTFHPQWANKSDPLIPLREKTNEQWEKIVSHYPFKIPNPRDPQSPKHVKITEVWHGTSANKIESILKSGFTSFGKHEKGINQSTDSGYFGDGIYGTTSACYATKVYSDGEYLILLWMAMRPPFPVTFPDMNMLKGQRAFENYNAHYVRVHSANPSNPNCKVYYPCKENEVPTYDEFVVFNKTQTVTRFLIKLAVDLPKQIPVVENKINNQIPGPREESTPPPSISNNNNDRPITSPTSSFSIPEKLFFRPLGPPFTGDGVVWGLTYHPTKPLLIWGNSKGTIHFCDTISNQEIAVLKGHQDQIRHIVLNQDGSILASSSLDNIIRFWDVSTKKEIKCFKGHTGIFDILFGSNKTIFASTANGDKTVRLWDADSDQEIKAFHHDHVINRVLFHPTKPLLAIVDEKRRVHLWNINTGEITQTFKGFWRALAFSHDGTTLATTKGDQTIFLWDIETGKQKTTLEELGASDSFIFHPHGPLLVSISSSFATIWDVSTRQKKGSLKRSGANYAAFTPDGSTLAIGGSSHGLARKPKFDIIQQWKLEEELSSRCQVM